MAGTVAEIEQACTRLRSVHAEGLARLPQSEVVEAILGWASTWRDPSLPWRRDAEALTEPFSFAMTRISLDALLASLTPAALWELIDAENVRGSSGAPLVGHVVAGNTPLLVWTSVLRALLMRSASFVKLPSGAAAEWGRLFLRSLTEYAPTLAQAVHLAHWPGGTSELDAALCRSSDLVIAYGGSQTIEALQALCPSPTMFLGYGHRVSFGIVADGVPAPDAIKGFARDVLLYDQGGCLSPHTIFVEGSMADAVRFGAELAEALSAVVLEFPPATRTPQAALRVREARMLARMEPDTVLWENADLRWTVIARSQTALALSPTHGVVSVQPISNLASLPSACAPVTGHLQGCAVAASAADEWQSMLQGLGISWICRPGELQAPPFSWREDGRDVLNSLIVGPLF